MVLLPHMTFRWTTPRTLWLGGVAGVEPGLAARPEVARPRLLKEPNLVWACSGSALGDQA